MARDGYDTTTLRGIGLLYRYFPSKRAVIFALYEELSAEYVRRASAMKAGKWRDRFMFALGASLDVLEPHRSTLRGLIPVLVGDPEEGLFGQRAAFSRLRVQGVFEDAVLGATDAPAASVAEAVGRLLYLVHLAVLMWWLLDRTPKQRATATLVLLVQQILPSAALTLRLPSIRRFVVSLDGLVLEGLFGER